MEQKNKKLKGAAVDIVIAVLLGAIWFVFVKPSEDMWLKSLALLCLSVWYLVSWLRLTRSIKSLFLFFLLYSILTNAGQLFLSVFSIEILYNVNVFEITDKSVMSKAIDYQALCTIMMCTGALVAQRIHSLPIHIKKEKFKAQRDLLKEEGGWSIQDLSFVVLGVIYFAMNIVKLGSRVDQTYLDAFNSGESSSAPFLLVFAFYILMYYACYTHRVKGDPFRKVIVFVNILVGLSNVLYGSRNVLIPMIFGMLFLWSYDFKKITFKQKIGIAVVALGGFYIMGAFVNIRRVSLSSLSPSFVFEALFGVNLFEQIVMLISEMGSSLRVLTTTIDELERGIIESEPTLLYTILKGIVPQVSILNAIGIAEPQRWRLSEWITVSHGSVAGWGYSMLAEAYYNFREFGCIFMGLFGYVYVWLENKIEKWYLDGRVIMASAWLFAAAYVIFLARADSLLFVTRLRYALYLGIACMILRGRVNLPKIKFTL